MTASIDSAEAVSQAANAAAKACNLHCITIVFDDSGSYRLFTPSHNKNVLTGILHRALAMFVSLLNDGEKA